MKKIVTLFFLLVAGISAYAQKEYVHVESIEEHNFYSDRNIVLLSGAIPSSMASEYKSRIGYVLNLLAKEGFVVDRMFVKCYGQNRYALRQEVLLSRSLSNSANESPRVKEDSKEEDVTEVARYNMQGTPMTEADKGMQIIVYSNYTIKTVLVE